MNADRLSNAPATDKPAAISFRGVIRRFGGLTAVDELTFDVGDGEVFGFIGPNGAGKTTSIKMMVGLLHPDAGDLRVAGHPMPGGKGEVHRRIGYLSQQTAFQSWRTVHQVLNTFGRLSGMAPADLPARIGEVLEQVGLTEADRQKAVHLSGGQSRRLGLAQAILHRPRILILDEPLAGLDPANRMAVRRIVDELVSTGVTVLFSSHILSDVQNVAHRVGIINRGHMVRAGTIDELRGEFAVGQDIEVELSRDSDGWRSLELPGVRIEQPVTHRLLAHVDPTADLDATVHALIVALVECDCRLRRVAVVTPGLDDIYFRLIEQDGAAQGEGKASGGAA